MSSMSGSSGMKEKRPHGYQKFSMQQFTPEQMQLLQQMFEQLGPESFLAKIAGGDEEAFAEMEAPALRQFSGLQGNLASRFSGMGSGARHGSGFQNASNAAASDFAQQLQSNRLGLQNQAMKDLQGMGNQLLNQRPYDQGYVKKDRGGSSAQDWGRLAGAIPGVISAAKGGGSWMDAFKGAASAFTGGF